MKKSSSTSPPSPAPSSPVAVKSFLGSPISTDALTPSPDTSDCSIPEPFTLQKAAFPIIHKPGVAYASKKNEAPEGYFYRDTTLPMAVGDVVARVRDPADIQSGFMRNEWDLLDGLYRLEKFHAAVRSTSESAASKKRKKTMTAEELEEAESNWKLSKKAKLTYPKLRKSKYKGEPVFQTAADQWVTLGDLRPALLQPPPGSTIVANNLSVSKMDGFSLFNLDPDNIESAPEHKAPDEESKEALETLSELSKNNDQDAKTKADATIPAERETKTPAATITQSKADNGPKHKVPIYFVHLKDTTYAVITEMVAVVKGKATWEVEKLRGKRVLLYNPDYEVIAEEGLVTESDDLWVKKLLKEKPDMCKGKIVVVEYLAHYAGWPDEDDEWELSVGKSSRISDELKADFAPTATIRLAAVKRLSGWVSRDDDEDLSEYEEIEDEADAAEEESVEIEKVKAAEIETAGVVTSVAETLERGAAKETGSNDLK